MKGLQDVGIVNKVPLVEKAVIQLRRNLTIETVEKSNVITAEYECYDPELAQIVVQVFVEKYKEVHSRVHRPQGGFKFLKAEVDRVAEELNKKQQLFENFKRDKVIVDVIQQKDGLLGRLQNAKVEYDVVEVAIKSMETEIKTLESELEKTDPLIIQEQITGAGNRAIDTLSTRLSQLKGELAQIEVGGGASDYRTGKLEATIKELTKSRNELKSEKETRMGVNKVYTEMKTNLQSKKPQLAALRKKEVGLAKKMDEIRGQIKAFTENEKEFDKLQVDVLLATQSYKKVVSNLQKAQLDLGRQKDGISNISQPQAPTVNYKPVSPNKLINLIAGVFIGGVLGCGLAVLKEYKRVSAVAGESQTAEPQAARPVAAPVRAGVTPVRTTAPSGSTDHQQVPPYNGDQTANVSASTGSQVPVHQTSQGGPEIDEDLQQRPAEWTQDISQNSSQSQA